jgi:hypothetical protein
MFGFSRAGPCGYRQSGKCDWFKLFTVALPLGILAAIAFALLMAKLLARGFYVVLLTPALSAMILAWLTGCLLRFSHCRNARLAAVLCGSLCFVMYAAYFQSRLVLAGGLPIATRIDLLPAWIAHCARDDVVKDQKGQITRSESRNWFMYGGDLIVAVLLGGRLAFGRNLCPYCEACSRWMVRKKAKVALGVAQMVAVAVASKQINQLPAAIAKGSLNKGSDLIEVECCPSTAEGAEICPIYFSAAAWEGREWHYFAQHVLLDPDELGELARRVFYPPDQVIESTVSEVELPEATPDEVPRSYLRLLVVLGLLAAVVAGTAGFHWAWGLPASPNRFGREWLPWWACLVSALTLFIVVSVGLSISPERALGGRRIARLIRLGIISSSDVLRFIFGSLSVIFLIILGLCFLFAWAPQP